MEVTWIFKRLPMRSVKVIMHLRRCTDRAQRPDMGASSILLRDKVAERVGPCHLSDPSHVEPLFPIHLVSSLGALAYLISKEEVRSEKRRPRRGRLRTRADRQVSQPLERITEPCLYAINLAAPSSNSFWSYAMNHFTDMRRMVSRSHEDINQNYIHW